MGRWSSPQNHPSWMLIDDAEDAVSAILLQEPGWCVEFKPLARRLSECQSYAAIPVKRWILTDVDLDKCALQLVLTESVGIC